MTMLATPSPKMRARSPSEDEETLVYTRGLGLARAPARPSSALFEELVRQLAAPLTPPRILHVQSAEPLIPIVFEDVPEPPHVPDAPAPVPAPAPRKRSRWRLPALVFAMSLGLGFGIAHDARARALVTAHARAAMAWATHSAMRLDARVSRMNT